MVQWGDWDSPVTLHHIPGKAIMGVQAAPKELGGQGISK